MQVIHSLVDNFVDNFTHRAVCIPKNGQNERPSRKITGTLPNLLNVVSDILLLNTI